MSEYSVPVCAMSSRSDRYVWVTEGTEEEVVSTMAREQDVPKDDILGNYEIEESDVEVPDDLVEKIISDRTKRIYFHVHSIDGYTTVKYYLNDEIRVLAEKNNPDQYDGGGAGSFTCAGFPEDRITHGEY